MDFSDLMIGTVPVMFVIIGLVEAAGWAGLHGNGKRALALVVGLIFGFLAYTIDNSLIPESVVPWVKGIVFGLAVGIASAGLVDVARKVAEKALEALAARIVQLQAPVQHARRKR